MATLWMLNEQGEMTPIMLGRDESLDASRFQQTDWRFVPLAPPATGLALLSRPRCSVRVNGERAASLHVLQHRDEIRIQGHTFWFSRESRPVISLYQSIEGHRAPKCAVCSMTIQNGDAIVVCPG